MRAGDQRYTTGCFIVRPVHAPHAGVTRSTHWCVTNHTLVLHARHTGVSRSTRWCNTLDTLV